MYAEKKKSNSSCIKYNCEGISKVGIILYFITVCKCGCENNCNECNDNCLKYAILQKYIISEVFYCVVSKLYIPTIFRCEELENAF